MIRRSTLTLALLFMAAGNALGAGFVHPGISHSVSELEFIKTKLKAREELHTHIWSISHSILMLQSTRAGSD